MTEAHDEVRTLTWSECVTFVDWVQELVRASGKRVIGWQV